MTDRLEIRGLQEAMAANERRLAVLRPSGELGRAVQYGTAAAHRHAVGITHVDTGSLKNSHRMRIEEGGRQGRIFIDPSAANPRSGRRTALYGFYEHERGGAHAFYSRTVDEAGPQIARQTSERISTALERAG